MRTTQGNQVMKIFVISQVRLADKDEMIRQKIHVEFYEALGHEVYWPSRDTNQVDPTGLGICEANFRSMQKADIVHVLWHPSSEGAKFDLGMAFALGKPIVPFGITLPGHGKSFPAMILHYFDKYGLTGAQLQRLADILRTNYQKVEVLPDKEMEIITSTERELGLSLMKDIHEYLHSHGIRATVGRPLTNMPVKDTDLEIIITTDMPVSGGEQEHIKNMAKGYKVVFRTLVSKEENGAC